MKNSLVLDTQYRSPRDDRLAGVLPCAVPRGRGVPRSSRGAGGRVAEHARRSDKTWEQEDSCRAQQACEHAALLSYGDKYPAHEWGGHKSKSAEFGLESRRLRIFGGRLAGTNQCWIGFQRST